MLFATSSALALALSPASQTRTTMAALRDLTVPAERLPAGCVLAPPPSQRVQDANSRALLSSGLPTNPWIGTDRRLVVSFREVIDGPAIFPDGPPLDTKALARYRDSYANGVEQAYGAVYTESDGSSIMVRAVKLASAETRSENDATGVERNARMIRVAIGSIVAVVNGEGDCFQAVAAYLKSLAH